MTDTKSAIKSLLCSFVCDLPPEKNLDIDWNALYKSAKLQQIEGILGYIISKYDICPNEQIKSKFEHSYITCVVVNTNKVELFKKLSEKLTEQGIDLAVFKGYVLRSLYPLSELRTFSDIDILIKSRDRQKSHALMQQLGYNNTVDFGSVYNYQSGLELYELHEYIIDDITLPNKAANQYFAKAWEHTTKRSDGLYVFDDEFHILFLIAHIAKHIRSGGAGIRMYLDLALYIKSLPRDFDYDQLLKAAESIDMKKFACISLYGACDWFGVQIPPAIAKAFVDSNKSAIDELYSYTIDRGLFGKADKTYGKATVEMLKSDGKKHPKISALFLLLTPPLQHMRVKYTFLEKAPFLLPFAWIKRFFDNTHKFRRKKLKLYDIVSADNASINKHQDMLDKIGL